MWEDSKPMYFKFFYDTLFWIYIVVYKWDWSNVYIVLLMSLSCTCLNPP